MFHASEICFMLQGYVSKFRDMFQGSGICFRDVHCLLPLSQQNAKEMFQGTALIGLQKKKKTAKELFQGLLPLSQRKTPTNALSTPRQAAHSLGQPNVDQRYHSIHPSVVIRTCLLFIPTGNHKDEID